MLTAGTRRGSGRGPRALSSSSTPGASPRQLVPRIRGDPLCAGSALPQPRWQPCRGRGEAGCLQTSAPAPTSADTPGLPEASGVLLWRVPALAAHLAPVCHQRWPYVMEHQIMSFCFRKLAASCCRAVYKVFIKVCVFSSTELSALKS